MEEVEFRTKVINSLNSNASLLKLKAQLRVSLLNSLALNNNSTLNDFVFSNLQSKNLSTSLLYNIVDSLIFAYFKKRNCLFSLSVFIPETGHSDHRNLILSENDLLQLLHLDQDWKPLARILVNSEHLEDPLLIRLINAIIALNNIQKLDRDIQTEPRLEDLVDHHLTQTTENHASTTMIQTQSHLAALEARIQSHTRATETRLAVAMQTQLESYKTSELAAMRDDEHIKYQDQLARLRADAHARLESEKNKVVEQVAELHRLLEAQRVDMEVQNRNLRERIIEDARVTLMREERLRNEAELERRSVELERDSAVRRVEEAVKEVEELRRFRERYERVMADRMS
ncbi:hypothetical protein HK096_002107, partial [Nowakowskiella sp. JEL0078]